MRDAQFHVRSTAIPLSDPLPGFPLVASLQLRKGACTVMVGRISRLAKWEPENWLAPPFGYLDHVKSYSSPEAAIASLNAFAGQAPDLAALMEQAYIGAPDPD